METNQTKKAYRVVIITKDSTLEKNGMFETIIYGTNMINDDKVAKIFNGFNLVFMGPITKTIIISTNDE